ncbi:MAG: hypothetical protein M1826_001081 [Phylliscum demangeonii]|nr:MAG: hypothetical protein M1826_001081 [Phylliscum demangeonii]
MDITHYIVSHRNKNVQLNGYNGYYTHASRELAAIRKKVGRSTPKGKKYAGALPVSAEDVASKPEFVSLLLLTAERAWAQAMHLKSLRTATGPTETLASSARKHIVSRLQRACKISQQLLAALSDRETSHSTEEDFLEAHAYSSLLVGGCEFERRRWKECLRAYAMAWMVYTALQGSISERIRKEDLKDLLSTVVDPSLRYAAYKMQIPRSHQISAIALQFLPRDGNDDVLSLINHLKPNLMSDIDPAKAASPASKAAEADGGSRIVTWRSRIVKIEDAAISQALGDVEEASAKLSRLLDSSAGPQLAKGKAAAYDEVLSASQDAVDATKHAIDELGAEGVGSSDARMQALQVTRTAVNYGLIGWRVGRNRILAGEQDGAVVETSTTKGLTRKKPLLAEGKEAPMPEGTKRRKAEGRGRLVGRLRERVVLYDGILQSIDSIKELAGVAADEPLMTDLQAKRSYFQALK